MQLQTLLLIGLIALLLPVASLKQELISIDAERNRLGLPCIEDFWKDCVLKKEFLVSNCAAMLCIVCLATALLNDGYFSRFAQIMLVASAVLLLAIMINQRLAGYRRMREE